MNIPITMGKKQNGKFLSCNDMFVKDINPNIATTIISGYYKGMDRDNANGVLVEEEDE